MYSPKIDKHRPGLYRLAQEVGKPMTKVADDFISFAFERLDAIYEELDQQKISRITQNINSKKQDNIEPCPSTDTNKKSKEPSHSGMLRGDGSNKL